MREQRPVHRVGRKVWRESLERLGPPRFSRVVVHVEALDPPEADQLRAVWVARAVREGVMLTMDCDPLLTDLTGGHPQDRAKNEIGHGADAERPVGQGAVKINRRREDGNLGDGNSSTRDKPNV